jgi:hypothetical protein
LAWSPLLAPLPPPRIFVYWISRLIWSNVFSSLPYLLPSVFLIEFLFKYNAITCPGCLAFSCGCFLANSNAKTMQYPLVAALPPPVVVSYWISMQIGCNIFSWPPYLPPRPCLITSYSNMMQYPDVAALPPPVVVTYWIPIQIWRNIHSWLSWLPIVVSYWISLQLWSNLFSLLPYPLQSL